MATQATQSNNALGKSSLPSPFFAPLQTLGRYMGRQPGGDPGPAGGSGSARDDESTDEQLAASQIAATQAADGRDGSPWREWSDGPGIDPDPEAVRGAISRLAREAQWPPEDTAKREGPSPGGLKHDATGTDGPAPESAAGGDAAGFAEVARRVWSATTPGPAADWRVMQRRQGAEATAPALPSVSAIDERTAGHSLETGTPAQRIAGHQTLERLAAEHLDADHPNADHLNADHLNADRFNADRLVAVNGLDRANVEASSGAGAVSGAASTTEARPGSAEAHALAHDASNLLSALRLYSELLCFSGVLHERHRHYAEDLKLLSVRSERLIDRLLQLAEQVAATERADETGTVVAAPPAVPAVSASAAVPSAAPTHALSVLPFSAISPRPLSVAPGPELLPAVEGGGLPEASLAEVLMRVRGVLGTIAHGALVVDLGPRSGLPVAAPVEALERVLVNLVSNAAAAVRDGGAIRIRAGAADVDAGRDGPSGPGVDPTVVLSVDDSGRGMTEAQLRSALGYQRPDPPSPDASRDGPSSAAPTGRRHGLGLSIVRELVALHGGKLFIHSRAGTGTRVEVHWPAARRLTSAATAARPGQGPSLRPSQVPDTAPRRSTVPSNGAKGHWGQQQPEFESATQGAVA